MSYTGNKNEQDGINNILYYNPDSTLAKDSLLHQLLDKNSNDFITSAQVSWIEPLDSTSSLELRYLINYTKSENSQVTNWLDPEGKMEKIESLKQAIQKELSKPASAISIIEFIELLIEYAYNARASDVHLEPEEKDVRVRLRIDGILSQLPVLVVVRLCISMI